MYLIVHITLIEKIESKIDLNKLKELYQNNALYICAKYFKVHEQTLRKIMVKNGIVVKTPYTNAKNRCDISKEQEQNIIEEYKKCQDMAEVSRRLDIKRNIINRTLKQNKIKLRKGTYLGNCKDIATEKGIINDYNSGCSLLDIAQKYNVYFAKVKKILQKAGFDTRKLIKYNLNESYFEQIDDFYKAYFLGLLYADGYIGKFRASYEDSRVGFVTISLQERDGYLVEKLAEVIKYTGKIRHIKKEGNRQNQKQLRIANTNFANYALKQGLTPRKSFDCGFPNLKEEFLPAFILGLFDGDGTMVYGNGGPRSYLRGYFGIIGSIFCMGKTREFINKSIQNDKNAGSFRFKKCQNNQQLGIIRWADPKDILKIYHLLYDRAPFFLQRKKDKFLDFFKLKNIPI